MRTEPEWRLVHLHGVHDLVNIFSRKALHQRSVECRRYADFFPWQVGKIRQPVPMARGSSDDSLNSMNTTPLHPHKLRGFKVVPKRLLRQCFSSTQSAYYVLLGRRGDPDRPRERVLLVEYVDHFLDRCQERIEELWAKRRVMITHVAVKPESGPAHRDLARTYERAVSVQQLRQKLQPRFRRL
jgi:hypothetical protein